LLPSVFVGDPLGIRPTIMPKIVTIDDG